MKRKNNYGINPSTGKAFKAQWEVLLHYLKVPGRKITQAQASADFGFTDLAGIVRRIEEHTGIRLARKLIEVKTRYGGITQVKQYWYEPKAL